MARETNSEAISHPPAESSGPNKRRQPESGDPTRKRLRYVAQACDQCKRQKVRCNGRKPCNRCERLRPRECCYQDDQHFPGCLDCGVSDGGGAPAEGIRTSTHALDRRFSSDSSCTNLLPTLLETIKVQAEKLDLLVERTRMFDTHITMCRHSPVALNPAPSTDWQDSNQKAGAWKPLIPTTILHPGSRPLPPFHGPTSSYFSIDLATLWLDQGDRNINPAQRTSHLDDYEMLFILDDEEPELEEEYQEEYIDTLHSVNRRREASTLTESGTKLSLDPLQKLTSDEAIELIRQYNDLIGARYPFIDTDVLIQQTKELFLLLQTPPSSDSGSANAVALSMDITNIHILKIVLAIVLVSEGTARRTLGYSLFKSLQNTMQAKILGRIANIKDLVFVTLVSLYYFYTDRLQVACRLSGTMARLALELGLHRRSTFSRPVSDVQNIVKEAKVFWSIYVLDRQWSFASGLPINLQETDIDPDLAEPDDIPYLRLMIRYARIGEKAWGSLSRSMSDRLGTSRPLNDFYSAHESLEFHEYQLNQWERSIPEELRFSHADYTDMRMTFLRTVLHLRANQMRIFMIRPFLCVSPGAAAPLGKCFTAMEAADDTIQIIVDIHHRSDMYRRQQALFNHFLVSALGLLYVLIIRDTIKEPMPSTTDRLSPHALAKAYTRLFHGLDVLKSLEPSTTTSRSLCNKLFPMMSRLKVLQSQNNDPAVYSSQSSLCFPAAYTRNTSLQGDHHIPIIDPTFGTTGSSTLDFRPQSITQINPDISRSIMDMFDLGEAYTKDDNYWVKDSGHHLMTPGNDCTFAASFSECQPAYSDSIQLGEMNWESL